MLQILQRLKLLLGNELKDYHSHNHPNCLLDTIADKAIASVMKDEANPKNSRILYEIVYHISNVCYSLSNKNNFFAYALWRRIVYDRQTHIVSLKLYLEASKFACNTFRLHRQVLECQRELNALTGSYMTADLKRISDLWDEIFGCELEIAYIHVRIRRAIQQVEAMRSLQGYARVDRRNKAAFVQA